MSVLSLLARFAFPLLMACFGVVMVACFRRWSWFGIAVLTAAVLMTEALVGTWAVLRPHEDMYPRATHWACHSMAMLPIVLMLAAGGAVALKLAGRSAGWGRQLGAVGMAFIIMLLPAIYVGLFWVVQELGCDTL